MVYNRQTTLDTLLRQTGSLKVWQQAPRNGGISILRFYDFSIFGQAEQRRIHNNRTRDRDTESEIAIERKTGRYEYGRLDALN